MSAKKSDQFFEEFKAIRKSKRLSINDISKAIKLQKEYIKAIESGNFDILSPVYIRLFIKSYSEYLELDVNKTLRLYGDYISGKSKKETSEETPKFIDKKSKGAYNKILDIGSKSSDNLINNYSRDPKKIVALSSVILMIIVCWIILARVSTTTHDNYKIKFDNTKLEWTFFENLVLLDSQYIKLKKVNKGNVFKYEYLDNKNKVLITNTSGINVVNKIINENDQDENTVNGNAQFGLLTGNIKFYINSQKIDFKYLDKTIVGTLNTKKKSLLIKYYK